MRDTCITPSELEAFLRSEHNEDLEIAAHLESCADCQNLMVEMSDLSGLECLCPSRADTTIFAADADDTDIVDRLKNIPKEARNVVPYGEPDPPDRIGQYEILTEIGSGGLGTVYLAYNRSAGSECALKELFGRRLLSDDAYRRCLSEMKSHWRLGQSSIHAASDLKEDDGVVYLVSGFIKGVDLENRVRSLGPFSVRDACRAIGRAAICLHQIHSAKLLHLNVKPTNLFLVPDGTITILDCGMAPLIQDELLKEDLSRSVLFRESVDFMSPEQARNVREAGTASDIYSLGCTLAFLLSGRRFFAADSPMQTMVAHREAAVPHVSRLSPDAPEELNSVLRSMLAKQPEQRFASMADVADALSPFWGESSPGDTVRVPQAPEKTKGGLRGWLSSFTKRHR